MYGSIRRSATPLEEPALSEDLSVLRSRLLSGTGDPAERASLVDALPPALDPAVVVGILVELLRWEQDPLVQTRALRRLGRLADAAVLDQVREFLRSDRPEVVAAAAEAILRLDRQRGVELIAPLLEEGDPARRVVVVRALLDVGTIDGSGVIVRLSLSESLDRRKLALEILASISTEVAWPLALRMFEREPDPELMDHEARLLERVLPEQGIDKLYELRLGLDMSRDDRGSEDPLTDQRLELLARTMASLFRTFRLTAREIEQLEEAFDRRARSLLTRVDGPSQRGDPRSESATSMARPRGAGAPARAEASGVRDEALAEYRDPARPPRASTAAARRTTVLAVAALLALGVSTLFTLTRPRARPHPGQPRPVALTTTVTALGKVGEDVTFEAEVLQVDPARSSLVVLKDRAIGAWIFVRGTCPWALLTPGRPVLIEGLIVAAQDPRSVYIEAASVRPAAIRP